MFLFSKFLCDPSFGLLSFKGRKNYSRISNVRWSRKNFIRWNEKLKIFSIAMETDKDHIHFLLEYDTTDRVCDIVKIIKQETTYYLWQKYNNFLSKKYWKKHIFWSDGYFACSIGEVSSATIQRYIESQG